MIGVRTASRDAACGMFLTPNLRLQLMQHTCATAPLSGAAGMLFMALQCGHCTFEVGEGFAAVSAVSFDKGTANFAGGGFSSTAMLKEGRGVICMLLSLSAFVVNMLVPLPAFFGVPQSSSSSKPSRMSTPSIVQCFAG